MKQKASRAKTKKPSLPYALQPRGKRNKVTVSLALDRDVVTAVKEDAEENRMSFNARVNAILEKYIKFFALTEQERSAIIPRNLHQFFIDEIDGAKYAAELKKIGTDVIDALFVRSGLANTLDNLIEFTFRGLCVNGGSITSVRKYIDEEDGKTCLYFTHDYDAKWSRILSAAFMHHIETVLHCNTTSKIFPEAFEIKILDTNPS